jgi:hypothetical protein
MNKKINRRKFLKAALFLAGGSVAMIGQQLSGTNESTTMVHGQDTNSIKHIYLPVIRKNPESTPPSGTSPRVVYTHSNNASAYTSGYFWEHVNQNVINSMVDQGLLTLTGTSTLSDAWRAIIPGYSSEQIVAIKVTFNNTTFNNGAPCDTRHNKIDAVVEPIIAIIRGLRSIGVPEGNIRVYDSFRQIPLRFTAPLKAKYPNVEIFDGGRGCNREGSPSQQNFVFSPPSGPGISPHPINQVLVDAHHLINVPIMKFHTGSGYSLALKNHFGSTTTKPEALHNYNYINSPYYSARYSPIVEINKNPHIRSKTRLILADALFCAFGQLDPPQKWQSFGNTYPNSLLFSFDPVAIDCIMADYLDYENGARRADFLQIAENAGLGVYERGNPWNPNYKRIDFQKINI